MGDLLLLHAWTLPDPPCLLCPLKLKRHCFLFLLLLEFVFALKQIYRQVTFGDSDGRFDTPVGSLALGWSVVLPSKTSAGNGMKALTGANAIVCAAGAGPLPSRTTRRRDIGFSLASAVEGLELPRGRGGETQVRISVKAGKTNKEA